MSLCQVRQPRHDRWSDCLLPLSDFLAPQRIQPHSPECHCDRPLFPVHFSPVLPAADLGRHLAATMHTHRSGAIKIENATNVQCDSLERFAVDWWQCNHSLQLCSQHHGDWKPLPVRESIDCLIFQRFFSGFFVHLFSLCFPLKPERMVWRCRARRELSCTNLIYQSLGMYITLNAAVLTRGSCDDGRA